MMVLRPPVYRSPSENLTPAGAFVSLVSSTPAYATPGALTAPATTNFFVAAVILGLFVLSAALSAERKGISAGFDEVAHASYVAHIQHAGDAWPELKAMRLIDPQSFRFTGDANYLNHPPLFYDLHAALGPRLEGRPQALLAHRLIDIAIASLGFAALLGLGLAARFPRHEFYAFAVPLACIPVLVPIAGAINNDNLAFLGGAAAMLGAWQLITTDRAGWLLVALLGLIAASWAKLTGFLLTGAMLGTVIAYLMWRQRLSWSALMPIALAFALAAAPYIIYAVQYGSPTPQTPAQIALLQDGARTAGWADLPRKSFPAYIVYFVIAFVSDWMPALGERNVLQYSMLAIPVAALGCALAGIALSLRRLWYRHETALDVVVIAGTVALIATFAIHVTYSYGRHLATGWLMDAYPRYYLPLAAIVPLAGLSLLAAVKTPRRRAALLAFLIAGPAIFRVFGAPLG
jgi:hypothetical protein